MKDIIKDELGFKEKKKAIKQLKKMERLASKNQ